MLPDLHELLDSVIGDVPICTPATLARLVRRRRQRQIGAVAGTAATVIAIAVAVGRPGADGTIVRTRDGSTLDTTATTWIPSTTDAPTTTVAPPGTVVVTTDAPTTTTAPPPAAPQVGDFTGTLTASATTVAVGDHTTVRLTITNMSDHVDDLTWPPDGGDDANRVVLDCEESDVGSARGGEYAGTGWTMGGLIAPGETRTLVADFVPVERHVGSTYCDAGILDLEDRMPMFGPFWSAFPAVPTLEITVVPAVGSTTTTSPAPTTVPASTTPTT
jgi:hypothetical protein